jgi:hypothetical protein
MIASYKVQLQAANTDNVDTIFCFSPQASTQSGETNSTTVSSYILSAELSSVKNKRLLDG